MNAVELSHVVGIARYFAGKVIDALDAVDGFVHRFGVKNRPLDHFAVDLGTALPHQNTKTLAPFKTEKIDQV